MMQRRVGSLVLSRRNNEKFFIGPDVSVEIFDCRFGRASVRIQAPTDIKIVRAELEEEPVRQDFRIGQGRDQRRVA